jgi:hypothetical protein
MKHLATFVEHLLYILTVIDDDRNYKYRRSFLLTHVKSLGI